MDLAAQAAGIGALADPVRRSLYEYVAAQPDAVGREAAAAAVRVPVHTAKFHLDRLCDEGLLRTEYRRLSGKTGPGAGRTAKLYRRADRQFAVSLPERRYDLAAQILATAVQQAGQGTQLADALRDAAYGEGRRLGAETSAAGPDLTRLGQALATQGFEPRVEGDALVLANCPFDALAREHTELVCGFNQWYVQGTADGLGCAAVRADLDPAPGLCCIRARLTRPPAQPEELPSGYANIVALCRPGCHRPGPAARRDRRPCLWPVPAHGHLRRPPALRNGQRYPGQPRRPADDQAVPRTWAESEAAGFRQVTLLWPPAEPGGYDLIADGAATYVRIGDDLALAVTVSRAVLHRRGPAPAGGGGPGCGSDCVPLTS